MKELKLQPYTGSLYQVIEFVEDGLREENCPDKAIFQINIAVDEIYSNIVHYSHAATAWIQFEIENNRIELRFMDDGDPYDPTSQKEPDVSLSSEERRIGGLGIFMVKKTMDEMCYEYLEGRNVLTIRKGW